MWTDFVRKLERARTTERTIRYAGQDAIHGLFTGAGFTAMADVTGFGDKALTLTTHEDLQTNLDKPPYAAFVTYNGAVALDALPEQGGCYWPEHSRFVLRSRDGDILEMRVTDDRVLCAGKSDDFAQAARSAEQAMR